MPKRRCSRPLEKEDFQEVSESVVQDAPIFDPANHDPLIRIINELDPVSFLKLARTCRVMKHTCFFSKGIEVRLGEYRRRNELHAPESTIELKIRIENDESTPEGVRFVLEKEGIGFDDDFTFSEELLEKVLKMPFRFVIDSIHYWIQQELNGRQIQALGHFLRRFRRIEIKGLVLFSGTNDWNALVELVQEFRLNEISIFEESRTPIPDDILLFFVTNLTDFGCCDYVPDDVILAATAQQVALLEAAISVGTFKRLLEKFAVGGMRNWALGRQSLNIDDGESDPFRTACSEVMKVVEVEDVDDVTMDPGVLYYSPSDPEEFHLMRHDASIGTLEIQPNFVTFA